MREQGLLCLYEDTLLPPLLLCFLNICRATGCPAVLIAAPQSVTSRWSNPRKGQFPLTLQADACRAGAAGLSDKRHYQQQ